MPPGQPYPYLALLAHVVAALSLFAAIFLAIFWTPGVVLSLFAIAYASDSHAFSQALDRGRRLEHIGVVARRYRGGWTDSLARVE